MKKSIPLIAAMMALVALTASCAANTPAPQPTPVAMVASQSAVDALVPCADLPALPTALCGTVTVPLDRDDPDSATTEIAFALVPRTDSTQQGLGTIVPNPGGPGSSTIDLAGEKFAAALEPLMDRRDVLLIDPRGVGRSDPITCSVLATPAVAFGDLAEQRAAAGACGAELGDRASYYGTTAVADDVDAVRQLLGIEKLDLLGISYGTFLMPVYAERYPDRVRTITLSGAYSVHDDPMDARGAAAFRRAVTLTCENTGTCSGDTVLADLAALATRLRGAPETIDVSFEAASYRVVVDEWMLASVSGRVFSNVPDPETLQRLADAAAVAKSGDLDPIRAFVTDSLVKTAEAYTYGPGLVSVAQTWATVCHDYVRPFDNAEALPAREADLDTALAVMRDSDFAPFSATAWITRSDYDAGACLEWPAEAEVAQPFAKGTTLPDVPVLVLNGDLDANTTSASGREAAAQFPHATFVEIAGAGHTPATTQEGGTKILTFIATGSADQ